MDSRALASRVYVIPPPAYVGLVLSGIITLGSRSAIAALI
jgi:hypothetical protein